ncbi:hypothetical protein [Actinoplanes couchii]|uniref:hypothetical protein n=1 Tax=Actinoplanes couchii TaxID=403638 RepID=UPI0019434680|nr:hypothetical protein [Actinoplanes couchii]MDR6317824.1 hypothetical protein [Actinoplanes couchii]
MRRRRSLVTLAAAMVAIGVLFVLGQGYTAAVARSCGTPRPAVPGAMLPLGIVAVALALVSVVLVVAAVRAERGRRFGSGDFLLAAAGVLVTLFGAYFGVAAVLMELSAGPVSCGG